MRKKLPAKHAPFGVFLLLLVAVLFLSALFFISRKNIQSVDTYYKKYSDSKKTFSRELMDNLSETIDGVGVEGVVSLILRAQNTKKLQSNECHQIMHLLGHQVYSRKLPGLADLLRKYGNMCEAGLLHGIEAQIVLDETDVKRRIAKLHEICTLFKSSFQNTTCYHGVGHVFFQQLHNPAKALSACNALEDESTDINPCYRGVFNELAYAIQGIDGETGLSVAGGPLKSEDISNPISYCNAFDTKYRVHCYSSILPLKNVKIPSPEFVSGLSSDEQKILNVQYPKVPPDIRKEHDEIAIRIAKESAALDINECKPVRPLVMKIRAGDKIHVKNNSSHLHTIMLNKDTSYVVKAHSSIVIDGNFEKGQRGLYGYGCDYSPYALGYFLIE